MKDPTHPEGPMKDLSVLREQWQDYTREVRLNVIPGLREAIKEFHPTEFRSYWEVLHKASAFGEEWFDKMPRLCWYGFVAFVVWKFL